MTETQFASAVEDLLERCHWKWCHFRPARVLKHGIETWVTPLSGHKGLPDYIATKNGRLLIFELKGDTGKISPDQMGWLNPLRETKAETYVWFPSDWDQLQEVLMR